MRFATLGVEEEHWNRIQSYQGRYASQIRVGSAQFERFGDAYAGEERQLSGRKFA